VRLVPLCRHCSQSLLVAHRLSVGLGQA
jgi:hypothetical protein